jgi:hypothetical protein
MNLDRDRPLQQRNRQDESPVPTRTQQDSFYAAKWPMLDSDALSNFQIVARVPHRSGCNSSLNRLYFGRVDRYRRFPRAHQMDDSWNRQHWEAVVGVEAGEDVPRKKGKIDFLKTVRPPLLPRIQRQERFQPSNAQVSGNLILVLTAHSNCVPIRPAQLFHATHPPVVLNQHSNRFGHCEQATAL